MIRRRYRIEASIRTLERFVSTLAKFDNSKVFLEKINANSTEEYYYVVCTTEKEAHEALVEQRFTDHIIYT